jgi:hypothetical protein
MHVYKIKHIIWQCLLCSILHNEADNAKTLCRACLTGWQFTNCDNVTGVFTDCCYRQSWLMVVFNTCYPRKGKFGAVDTVKSYGGVKGIVVLILNHDTGWLVTDSCVLPASPLRKYRHVPTE